MSRILIVRITLIAALAGCNYCVANENTVLGTEEASTLKQKAIVAPLIAIISDIRLQYSNPLLVDQSIVLLGICQATESIPALMDLVPYLDGKAPVYPGPDGSVPFPRVGGAGDAYEKSIVITALILIGKNGVNEMLSYFCRPDVNYRIKEYTIIVALKGIMGDALGMATLRQYKESIKDDRGVKRIDECINSYSSIMLDDSVVKDIEGLRRRMNISKQKDSNKPD